MAGVKIDRRMGRVDRPPERRPRGNQTAYQGLGKVIVPVFMYSIYLSDSVLTYCYVHLYSCLYIHATLYNGLSLFLLSNRIKGTQCEQLFDPTYWPVPRGDKIL